jgi:Tol biopolymer transport system component
MTPVAFDHVVRRCLAKDPNDRWQTVRDLRAELQWVASGSAQASVAVPAETVAKTAMPRWAWAAAVVAAVALFAAGWLLHRPAEVPLQVVRSSVLLPAGTVLDTNNKSVALSPDGTTLAYAGRDSDGRTGIWARRLDSLVAQHLAGTEGASYPFWSPDGRYLGFFASGKLRKILATGGTAQTVCDAADGRGASWGADGVIVFAPAPYGGLMQVAAAGGAPTPATIEERPDWTHRNPHFLPDGKRVLYFAGQSPGPDPGAIYGLDVSTGETAQVLAANSEGIFVEPGYVAFVREGNLMVQPMDRRTLKTTGEAVPLVEGVQFNTFRWTGTYAFSPTGLFLYRRGAIEADSRLTWFDLEGNELGSVGEPATFWFNIDISPDGRRAVTSIRHADGKADLWMYDLERSVGSKFTFGDVAGVGPLWSPDGSQVAFSDGGGRILVKAADGTGAWRAVTTDAILPWDWTPDGSQLLVMQQSTEMQLDLALVPVSGDAASTPLRSTPANETQGSFSPDGRWLALLSDESDRNEAYVVAFPGPGGKWQISSSGAEWVRWLPDGSGMVYANPGGDLFLVPISARGSNLEIGTVRPLGGWSRELAVTVRTLAPDGKRFLVGVNVSSNEAPALTLVTNWAAELE